MQELREILTRCFCCSAAVGAASAVPDHQLSTLHHGFKCLSVKAHMSEYTQHSWQKTAALLLITTGLLSFVMCFRMLGEVMQVGQGTQNN